MSHTNYKQDMLERMKMLMPVNTDLNLGINYKPQGPLSNLGREMGDAARIGFNDSPSVVSSVDQDKQKYYSTLVQAGVDPSMARQIAGVAAPVKGSLDKWTGKSAWHPGVGGSSYYPDSIFTDVTGGGSIEGIWNY